MKSIPPANYASLPKLRRPAAYICVIRDVDSDRYRLQATHDPRSLIEAALTEGPRAFGIELLAILESDNIAESEARLYERHHAALGEEWLALDDYQLRELRRSELKVYSHRSRYIGPDEIPSTEQAQPTESVLPLSQSRAPEPAPRDEQDEAQRSIRQPATGSIRYGAQSLRQRRELLSASELPSDHSRRPIRQAIDEAITDLWTNHPWKCLAALALIVLFCLATFDWSCSPRTGCPDTRPSTGGSDEHSSEAVYRVEQIAIARDCRAQSCRQVKRLLVGTEVRAIAIARGEDINGNDLWVKFRHNDATMYVHSGALSRKR